jgi:hypothetical protein
MVVILLSANGRYMPRSRNSRTFGPTLRHLADGYRNSENNVANGFVKIKSIGYDVRSKPSTDVKPIDNSQTSLEID